MRSSCAAVLTVMEFRKNGPNEAFAISTPLPCGRRMSFPWRAVGSPFLKTIRRRQNSALQFLVRKRLNDDAVPSGFENSRPQLKGCFVCVNQNCLPAIQKP